MLVFAVTAFEPLTRTVPKLVIRGFDVDVVPAKGFDKELTSEELDVHEHGVPLFRVFEQTFGGCWNVPFQQTARLVTIS